MFDSNELWYLNKPMRGADGWRLDSKTELPPLRSSRGQKWG
jgi:hypothetical protein